MDGKGKPKKMGKKWREEEKQERKEKDKTQKNESLRRSN